MVDLKRIAPLQLIVIGFFEPKFEGKIMKEINRLRKQKMIRIVDSLAVQKSINGEVSALQLSDLPKGEAMEYGALVGYLIGLGSGNEEIAEETALGAALQTENEFEYGISPEELETVAEDIPRGGAAVILLVEHLWALPFRRAVREANGIMIAQDFLSPETLIGIGQETLQNVSH